MPTQQRRLVIAIDYGTTYTGAAYATPDSANLPINEIDLIDDWGPKMGNHPKIPSVISFSPRTEAMEEQWGSDLSEDAVTMVHTKLELDVLPVTDELDLLIQGLDGMSDLTFENLRSLGPQPAYTALSAEQIVTEYLTRVFERVSEVIRTSGGLTRTLLDQLPVDIVVTIPTEWSYRAKNSTYRALTQAGFDRNYFPLLNDVIFVTEPEAAAIFTARYLKESSREEFLRPDECFVLCDAGGGTVDVVSYKVKQLEPSLEVERVGIPTGDKCGAIHIDIAFKKWLREFLGDRYYEYLDENAGHDKIGSHSTEGRAMRELMRQFDLLKKAFHKGHRDMQLELPPPLDNLTLASKVNAGEIVITEAVMRSFFTNCVGKIMELIEGQIQQIARLNKRTKNIFLVGGFAESPYLQQEIDFSLRLRKIKLRRPETSWTAVVCGAVLCGIEKDTLPNLSKATPCPQHFGISLDVKAAGSEHDTEDIGFNSITNNQVALGQMQWLLSKGDVILSDKPLVASQGIAVSFRDGESKKMELTIYSYPYDDERPTKLKTAIDELQAFHVLHYDLVKVPQSALKKSRGKNGSFYTATVKLTLTLTAGNLSSVLSWNGIELATGEEPWHYSSLP